MHIILLGYLLVMPKSILTILYFLLWIVTIIQILRANFGQSRTKVRWLLVVTILPVLGIILYWTIGRRVYHK